MIKPIGIFMVGLRYLFMIAALTLVFLAAGSIVMGTVELVKLVSASGIEMEPGSGAQVVPYFIRAAFLYFLAIALWSLFVADVPAPQWMIVKNLFQLRTKVLAFVSIVLPLSFMGKMMDSEGMEIGTLYSGAGVFLVLLAIFFLTRFGSPSGDEGMAREGNRVQEGRSSSDRPGASASAKATADKGRRSQQGSRPRSQADEEDWLKKQKENLKFQKESMEKAVEKDLTGDTGGSHVTVKPGPRRPRGRR